MKRVRHRATVVTPQAHRATAPARRLTELHKRLLREETRLEGSDETADAEAHRVQLLAKAALPAGARLNGFGIRREGWHLSLLLNSDDELAQFVQNLTDAATWQELRVDSTYSGNSPDGQLRRVVCARAR